MNDPLLPYELTAIIETRAVLRAARSRTGVASHLADAMQQAEAALFRVLTAYYGANAEDAS